MSRTATSRESLLTAAKNGADGDSLLVRKGLVPDSVETVSPRVRRFTISTGAVDRDNDTINPKGWDIADYMKNPVVLWAHDYKSLPVGKATSVAMSDGKLVSECEFAEHPFAETVLRLIDGGFLRATSVGFRPKKYLFNEERGGIDFAEQSLMEYSVVPVPANPEALIDMSAAKAAGIDVEPLLAWAKGVLKADAPVSEPAEEQPTEVTAGAPKPTPDDENGDENKKPPKPMPNPMPCAAESQTASVTTTANSTTTVVGDISVTETVTTSTVPLTATLDVDLNIRSSWDTSCRICNQELVVAMPRLRDDLGVVCAPCFVRAAGTATVTEPAPAVVASPVEGEIVFDLLDNEEVIELADETNDEDVVADLSLDEVREALRSAVTSAVSTLVRDETRAALNRARGRVD